MKDIDSLHMIGLKNEGANEAESRPVEQHTIPISNKSQKELLAEIESLKETIRRLESEKNADASPDSPAPGTAKKSLEPNKELNCLYRVSMLIDGSGALDEILEGIIGIIPSAWHHPEEIGISLFIDSRQYASPNYRTEGMKQEFPVRVNGVVAGHLEIRFYQASNRQLSENKNDLLKMIAERIGRVVERINAERQLAAGEAKYKSLVSNLNEGIWAIDPDARTTFVNPRMTEIMGFAERDMIGRYIYDFMEKEDGVAARESLRNHQVETRTIDNFILIGKGGMRIITCLRTAPIFGADGSYEGALAAVTDLTQSEETRDALVSSEIRFRHIIESNADGILIIDDNGLVIYANPAAEELLGRTFFDLAGTSFGYPLIENEATEVELRTAQGTLLTAEMRAVKIKWNGGQATLASLRDVTTRKDIEHALQKSEVKYRLLADNTLDVIWSMNLDLVTTYVNPSIREMTGYSPDEWIGTRLPDHFDPKDSAHLIEVINRTMKGSDYFGGFVFEGNMMRKDGPPVYVELRGSVLLDSHGDPASLQGITRDMTERMMAERALKASDDRQRKLLDNLSTAIVIINSENKEIIDVNPAAAKLVGLTREDVIGHSCRKFFCDARAKECILTAKEPVTLSRECKLKNMDGKEVPVLKTIVPIELDGKEVYLETFADISQMKILESQLNQAQKMEAIGRLAGGVAHDFNNILTTIIGTTRLIKGDLEEDDPLQEDVQEISAASERAADLTRQLLAFSRKQMQELKIVNLNDTILGLEKMLHRLIGEDISLDSKLSPDLNNVEVDPGQMEQVIMNLVINARDAMPFGGKIILETSNIYLDEEYQLERPVVIPGDYVLLSITDTGIGMDEETEKHIFEPFFTTKETGKGTGLGLATVYGIIKQSNGYIWVYSEVGRGTSFKIYLPVTAGDVDPYKTPRPVIRRNVEFEPVVLVVEDDPTVRKLIQKALEKNGFKVLIASMAEEAFEKIQSEKPDVVLSDVVMPGLSGPEMVDELKKTHPDLKVVFMSGYTEHACFKDGMITLGDNFLHKPFSPESLIEKVQRALEQ